MKSEAKTDPRKLPFREIRKKIFFPFFGPKKTPRKVEKINFWEFL
jgi:hypothetical protein